MIPVSLVTGFLGSGKTTLLSRLLRAPGLAGTLVVVNEFGEVGIDHDLLEASSDDTILLANGCLCCTIRGNLVDTLQDVQAQRDIGRLRGFDRVVVETSGLADPAPLLGFLFGEPSIAACYRPAAVITTCDAVAGLDLLDRHAEAVSQVAVADRLLLTKTDLAPPAAADALRARLRELNARAPIAETVQGEGVWPEVLEAPRSHRHDAACPTDRDAHAHHHHAAHITAHAERFQTLLLLPSRPLSQTELGAIRSAIADAMAPSLLRLKGILPLAEGEGFAVIQAAPGFVHAPSVLQGRPSPQPCLVAILDGPAPAGLLSALAAFGILPAKRAPPAGHGAAQAAR